MDQRMVNYSTSSKSKRFSRKVVDYLLDTAIGNAQTIYNLNANQNPRKSNSFDYRFTTAEGLVTPHMERRPLSGLQDDVINKMSFFLGRTIDKTKETAALDAAPSLPTQNVTTRAESLLAAEVKKPSIQQTLPKPKAIKFENHGAKRKCSACLQLLLSDGKKKAKNNLTKHIHMAMQYLL